MAPYFISQNMVMPMQIKGEHLRYSTCHTELHQKAIRDACKSIKQLQGMSLDFASAIRGTHQSFIQALSLMTGEDHEPKTYTEQTSNTAIEQQNVQWLKTIAERWLLIGDAVETFAKETAVTALDKAKVCAVPGRITRDPIHIRHGSRKLSPDNLIQLLGEVTTKGSPMSDQEDLLRRNIVQTHYELANAVKFYRELKECDMGGQSPSLVSMAHNRIKRIKRILSMSICEIISVDTIYEDFFLEYLLAMKSSDKDESIHGDVRTDEKADTIQNATPRKVTHNDISAYKTPQERLERCVMAMGSLFEEFIAVVAIGAPPKEVTKRMASS